MVVTGDKKNPVNFSKWHAQNYLAVHIEGLIMQVKIKCHIFKQCSIFYVKKIEIHLILQHSPKRFVMKIPPPPL